MNSRSSRLTSKSIPLPIPNKLVRLNWMVLAVLLWMVPASPLWAKDIVLITPKMDSSILTLDAVFEGLEEEHPLLKRARAKRTIASGKLLKALGKIEPKLVNDWELERLVKNGATKSVGFNDTYLELQHRWGIKGFVGFRAGIGDVQVADLGIDTTNQPLLGIVIPLLRGFLNNPENAQIQKSSLADKLAMLDIQQTRQELYLGAATQYWNWVAALKILEVNKQAVRVAEARVAQLMEQVETGARANFDVIDARQEAQWRKNQLIQASRRVEKEQFKLALFMWKDDDVVVPESHGAPAFPPPHPDLALASYEVDRTEAVSKRPEVQQVNLEAEFNQIDLKVAENKMLPELLLEATPTRKPGEFVLGLGYRFGVQLSIPFLQRQARGELLEIQGEAERLRMLRQYQIQKIKMDVDNARSSLLRARERVEVLRQSLDYARELEKGERTRFQMGAADLLVVNIRERNVLSAQVDWINALSDYQKALARYHWATGKWAQGKSREEPQSIKEND